MMKKEGAENISSEEVFFTVEGKLTEFHMAATNVNLLSKIERSLAEKNLAGGVAAAINGMPGALANAAMLSFYDGEDMYNFAGLVNGKVVCGVFRDADKIKDGDIVKLVVTQRKDVLYVHSLLRIDDSLLLMPLNTYCGERAFFWNCMKFARNMILFMWVMAFAAFFSYVDISVEKKEYIILACGTIFLVPLIFWIPFEYWSFRTMRDYSICATEIFSAHGFPRPSDFDMRAGATLFKDHSYGFIGYSCELALKKHMSKYKIQSA
ncbi:hypothetical protein ACWYXK_13540 [Janthinobacterium lividum]|uniref:hypothetical protein n=1 Tax=Janthinobacterium sp. BJB446 TaxID=2048009 RepID=UPI000C1127BE|nr:hypothetical protein [Janthinobacterium sp. BJB446]PHV22420.1 hypothetical protein CSQ92_04960 [Janthinobacterium sp. BJB446]